MIKWYFLLLGSVVVGLLVLVVQFGLNPRPKSIIKPSHFSDFQVIGQTIFRQMHKDINPAHIVALGVSHASDLDIILGLLTESQKYNQSFHTVLILNHLKSLWEKKESTLDLKIQSFTENNYASILAFLKEKQKQSEKTLIIANPEDVSHLQNHSLIQFLENDLKQSILSFIRVDCVLEHEKLQALQKLCRRQSQRNTSFSHLSCIAHQKSLWLKKLKSKRLDKNKNIVFLQQYGLLDYIYFISTIAEMKQPS